MANSRLEKLGTIFGRVTALLRSGAMKRQDKPLWYEVYQVFPPRDEPSYSNVKRVARIRKIFYPEDRIRAKFHQKMYRKLPAENLAQETTTDITRRAINLTYDILRENPSLTEDQAVDKMMDTLKADGILGPRRSYQPQKMAFSTESNMDQSKSEKPETVKKDSESEGIKNVVDKHIDVSSILKGK